MNLVRTLSVLAPLALAPMLGGCVAIATSDYSAFEEVVEVVHLKHAVASTLADTLREVAPDPDPRGRWEPVRITTDPRTNSILISGQRGRVERLVEIAKDLDTKS